MKYGVKIRLCPFTTHGLLFMSVAREEWQALLEQFGEAWNRYNEKVCCGWWWRLKARVVYNRLEWRETCIAVWPRLLSEMVHDELGTSFWSKQTIIEGKKKRRR